MTRSYETDGYIETPFPYNNNVIISQSRTKNVENLVICFPSQAQKFQNKINIVNRSR